MMVGGSCILIRRHREGSNRLVSEVDSTFCRSNYASFIAEERGRIVCRRRWSSGRPSTFPLFLRDRHHATPRTHMRVHATNENE